MISGFIVNVILVVVCVGLVFLMSQMQSENEAIQSRHETDILTMKNQHAVDIQTNRKDAVERSRAVLKGKISEHMIPHMPEFGFKASDARFMGSPIDYIVFDGMSDGDIQKIILIDIKTGKSRLNNNQRQIRTAVDAKKVEFMIIAL